MPFNRPTQKELIDRLRTGDKAMLARAITLAESKLESDRQLIAGVLEKLPVTLSSVRIAVSGPPGSGKSTLIETFGKKITEKGHKISVLTIDPSSKLTGGSLMGDKTRMEELSKNPNAFIRPSSAGKHLGGIHVATPEAIVLSEAAGFDFILIETVGVGQSETEAASFTDIFLLVLNQGSGDELQALKKGIMEWPDAIIITKQDRDPEGVCAFERELRSALHFSSSANPEIFIVSSTSGLGFDLLIDWLDEKRISLKNSDNLNAMRKNQNLYWFESRLKTGLWEMFSHDKIVAEYLPLLEQQIVQGQITPVSAALKLLSLFDSK